MSHMDSGDIGFEIFLSFLFPQEWRERGKEKTQAQKTNEEKTEEKKRK